MVSASEKYLATSKPSKFVPTISCQMTEQLAVGIARTVMMARVLADPLFLAPPDDANGDGIRTFGPGVGTRFHWGGVPIGAYYATDIDWNFGFTFKSPQWFEKVRIRSQDELGHPVIGFQLHLPANPLLGNLLYRHQGFRRGTEFLRIQISVTPTLLAGRGSDRTGPSQDWVGTMSLAWQLACTPRLGNRLTARVGYSFNDTLIDDDQSQFNVASPLIIQHLLSLGADLPNCRLHGMLRSRTVTALRTPSQAPSKRLSDLSQARA